jgi:manganese/iron transport system substrate-binding protein
MTPRTFLGALVAIGALAVACTTPIDAIDDQGDSRDTSGLRVVSTVSPITSLVETIGGSRVRLDGIIPEGVNSHTYEPAPSVATLLGNADLIVANGLFLEEPTIELAEVNKKPGAVILILGDRTITREEWKFDFSFPESDGNPNPHLWPDPLLALRYAELVRDALSELDPDGADEFARNYAALSDRITALDQAIREAVATVPVDDRQLLTYHDSWAYFAQRYGLSVVGAAEPSDFSEPSAREVADLIDQLRDLDLRVVFGSEVFPSQVLEQVAAETGASFVDDLRDDDLPGAPGDPGHSYIGLMVQNMRIMIPALGGSAGAFDSVDITPVFDGTTNVRYPQ